MIVASQEVTEPGLQLLFDFMNRKPTFEIRFLSIITGQDRSLTAFLIRIILRILQLFYWLITTLRNIYYSLRDFFHLNYRADCPVICVGNLSAGGTGKTPMIVWLARHLQQNGLRVAILSRGYGAKDLDGMNDEAREMAKLLPDIPHVQNPNRVQAAKLAMNTFHPDVILLDDGFQYRRLHCDMNIVLLDSTQDTTFSLLPRGLLREPASSLRRADAVLLTRCDQAKPEFLEKLSKLTARYGKENHLLLHASHHAANFENISGTQHPLSAFQDKKIGVFCGIGNPDAFLRTINEKLIETNVDPALTANDERVKIFPDHYSYPEEAIRELEKWAAEMKFDVTFSTGKDLVKVKRTTLGGVPLFALKIEIQLEGEAKLSAKMDDLIQNFKTEIH